MGQGEFAAVVLGPLRVGVFGQRLTAPFRLGRDEGPQRVPKPAGDQMFPAGLRPGHEDLRVNLAAAVVGEEVPTGARRDEGGIPEGVPGPTGQDLEVHRRVGRQSLRPQGLDEDVPGHERPPPGRQQPDERPRQAPAEGPWRDLRPITAHPEPPQEADLEELRVHVAFILDARYRIATPPLQAPRRPRRDERKEAQA